MGGSGSNGWTPSVPSSPCERVNFRANVNSPQPDVIAGLALQTVLQVAIQADPVLTVVVLRDGKVLGSLTVPQVTNLIGCIQNGYEYSATVVAINGGNCAVQVTVA